MKVLGYYNGVCGPLEEMTVPMNDRACYFGDGVYEAAMARNGVIFGLDEHMDRLFNSAGLLDIQIPYTKKELADILYDLLGKMDDSEIFIYWQISRGTAMRKHEFPEAGVTANLWITMKPGSCKEPDSSLKLITVEDTRFFHCNIKTLNLLPNVMASQKAVAAGCGGGVFHRGDIVTGGGPSNVPLFKDGVFKTHPTDHFILPGITRMHLIQECKKLLIPVDETPFTLEELFDADEIIVSSTSKLCSAACELNGKPVGGKDTALLRKLQESYYKRYLETTKG